MLYALYEMNHAAMAPTRLLVEQSLRMLRHPYHPLSHTLVGKTLAAGFDLVEQTTRRYGKPRFGLSETSVDGRTVAVTEHIQCRKPFGQLRHFQKAADVEQPKLLIVAPMSGHFATLLRGTVAEMLPEHDVYITDWRDARNIPICEGRFDLDDYVDYLIEWLSALGPNTHILAVCQPAVPVFGALCLMEADKHPATPASVTLMGGPIDTREAPTRVNQLAQERSLGWFERNALTHVTPPHAGALRRVYPGFLQLAGFMTMNLGDHMVKHQELFRHLIEGDEDSAERIQAFYEEYRAVMDITAEFYLQTIDVVFQRHALPKGQWVSRGRPIDPCAIKRTPLMAIEGELDDISGVGQTKAALAITSELSEDRKRYLLAEGVGHYGIFNGSRWRSLIAPEVKRFIRAHHAH